MVHPQHCGGTVFRQTRLQNSHPGLEFYLQGQEIQRLRYFAIDIWMRSRLGDGLGCFFLFELQISVWINCIFIRNLSIQILGKQGIKIIPVKRLKGKTAWNKIKLQLAIIEHNNFNALLARLIFFFMSPPQRGRRHYVFELSVCTSVRPIFVIAII